MVIMKPSGIKVSVCIIYVDNHIFFISIPYIYTILILHMHIYI